MNPSGNLIDVTYPRVVLLDCIIPRISLNMGEQLISELKDVYRGSKMYHLFSSLVSILLKRIGMHV